MPEGPHEAGCCEFQDAPGCFVSVIVALPSRSVTHPDQDVSCQVVPLSNTHVTSLIGITFSIATEPLRPEKGCDVQYEIHASQ